MFSGEIVGVFVGTDSFKLKEDLSYSNNEIKVTAKAGLVYDMASIPRMFWRIIGSPYIGKYRRAATLHDALYASQGLGVLTKEQVDKLFLEIMEVEDVSWWKRNSMYYAVRWFGSEAWNSIEKDGKDYCEIINLVNNNINA